MHRLLKRQIQKHLTADLQQDVRLQKFCEVISEAYVAGDEDRILLERSLELTSSELMSRNNELQRDVTRIAEAHNQLKQSLATLNATFEASFDGLVVFDAAHQIVTYNKLFLTLLAISEQEAGLLFGQFLKDILAERIENAEELLDVIRHGIKDPEKRLSVLLKFKNGRFLDCISLPRYIEKNYAGRVWSLHDVTSLKISQDEAQHRAYHDALTGLPNRALMYDRLQYAIEHAKRHHLRAAVLFLDLDGFKEVNDSLGHDAGDELLIKIAHALKAVIRGTDSVGRIGGDEFLVLLEDVSQLINVTDLAERIIFTVQQPFLIKGEEIHISTSVGIALSPNDGDTPENLMLHADMAMYHAKRMGRNTFEFFAKELALISAQRLQLRNRLKNALLNDQFYLEYQPVYACGKQNILHMEALLRWRNDEGELISPADFIPIAEENGLIVAIGEWVLQQACAQLSAWQQQGFTQLRVSVNLSPRHFTQDELLPLIQKNLQRYHLPAQALGIEITETVFMQNLEQAVKVLTEINKLGINISVDDFGTGYSSLGYLKKLPVHQLKIDKSFVDEIHDKRSGALIFAIISMAHILGLKVVAEGVEDEDSATLLGQQGCDYLQGFHLSRPLSAQRITDLLKAQKK
jgi:diguanylate cyclase (GGDEF)-like protein